MGPRPRAGCIGSKTAEPLIPRTQFPRSWTHFDEASAFARGPRERPLRIVVDRESTPDGSQLEALLELAWCDSIDMASTAPADAGASHLEIRPIDREDDMAPVST